jgi:hypothetical protein
MSMFSTWAWMSQNECDRPILDSRVPLARPATIPRARAAETERKAISYHFLAQTRPRNHGLRSLIDAIVQSELFLTK